jgi:DNA-binding transcriptional regulator YdaS (Cro superfamily)
VNIQEKHPMNNPTALDRAAEAAGSWGDLARKLGVSHQAMYAWRKRGHVPPNRALEIEVLYGVPARELVKPSLLEIATLITA